MTKELIVERELNGEELEFFGDQLGNLFDCMDEWAKHQAIEFSKWILAAKLKMYSEAGDDKDKFIKVKNLTTEELYSLFIEHQKQQP